MRIIIACAGSQDKWNNYLGVPSHLVPLKRPVAEPLLKRTIRQALQYAVNVHVTVPDKDKRYDDAVEDLCHTHVCLQGQNEYDATRTLWNTNGRTVLLLGDVFFSDEAMMTICGYAPHRIQIFGRFKGSRVTGTPYGEIFAASWWPENQGNLERHLRIVIEAKRSGACTRPAGWALLRSLQGTPLNMHQVRHRWFKEIDDATDDFDFKNDYLRHPATR